MADDKQGTTVRDVKAADFIAAYAAHLKKSGTIAPPEWTTMIKTATHRELGPSDSDWYFTRAASIARRVYLRPTGVGQLQRVYGGKARRGTRTNKFQKMGTGHVIRNILQQFESKGLVEKIGSGRKISKAGQKDLDLIALQVRYPDDE